MKPRKNECIGGGWLVFRRGKRTNRIGVKAHPGVPFEHPTEEAAQAEADRMAEKYPGETFSVFRETDYQSKVDAPVDPEETEETEETEE